MSMTPFFGNFHPDEWDITALHEARIPHPATRSPNFEPKLRIHIEALLSDERSRWRGSIWRTDGK